MLTILLLAQMYFLRPHFPERVEVKRCDCKVLNYHGQFIMPKNGMYTLNYETFYPGNYGPYVEPLSHPLAAAPRFDDRKKPGHGNQIPIYVADEYYDHITVKANPGTHWWYTIMIAVPK